MFSITNTQRIASLRITREHGGVANVGQSQEEHHHTLQTDSAARVRVGSVREGLEIGVQRLDGNAAGLGSLGEELGIVDSLSTGHDFLSANEDIVGVGELLAMREIKRKLRDCGGRASCRRDGWRAGTCRGCRSRCCTSP